MARVRDYGPVPWTAVKATRGRNTGPMPTLIRSEGFSKNAIDSPHRHLL